MKTKYKEITIKIKCHNLKLKILSFQLSSRVVITTCEIVETFIMVKRNTKQQQQQKKTYRCKWFISSIKIFLDEKKMEAEHRLIELINIILFNQFICVQFSGIFLFYKIRSTNFNNIYNHYNQCRYENSKIFSHTEFYAITCTHEKKTPV